MTGTRGGGRVVLDVLGLGTLSLTLDVGARVPHARLVLPTVLLCLYRAREENGTWHISVAGTVFAVAVVRAEEWVGMSRCRPLWGRCKSWSILQCRVSSQSILNSTLCHLLGK